MTPHQYVANYAYQLASQGLPVFPCKENKQPATMRGFYDATTDPARARGLFLSCPNACLIGVPTGRVSGLAVIDIDPQAVHWFRSIIVRFTETRMHTTRRNGYHLIYQCPDPPIKNTASKLAVGCDTRGEGGYFIWWPDFGGACVHEVDPAQMPRWIVRKLSPKPQKNQADVGHERSGNVASLENFVARAGLGERNSKLFWSACRLGEMVAAHKASIRDQAGLMTAAMQAGLSQPEAYATIRSGLHRTSQVR